MLWLLSLLVAGANDVFSLLSGRFVKKTRSRELVLASSSSSSSKGAKRSATLVLLFLGKYDSRRGVKTAYNSITK